ncbi:GTP pyrophosphokinase [Virgibacillus oceani]|uniref:RelA/SpoT domain-containing protein n=1 Tax=Virgibacillus oceani TaxID=1479511 RepID=A0A917H1L7_9BACI|nr:hypothetical protein [Virgibacillus oceani]GGG64653.1 hypothetical protein GCM10011398_05330 [Virgibacillus oceani]
MEDNLRKQYSNLKGDYQLLCEEIIKQLKELIRESDQKVNIAVPIEYRVKQWDSVIGKIEKYQLDIDDIADINDLAGIRITVLFRRDVVSAENIIDENFVIHRKEDTEKRLSENQFGYGSIHYEVSLPEEWTELPSLNKLKGKKVEIQLRTVSQHTWAASSHILQYKKEQDVPIPLRRSINRVAALLETVDLEFERLLVEREDYKQDMVDDVKAKLNVESLRNALLSEFPRNEDSNEPYSELLELLSNFNINNLEELNSLITNYKEEVLAKELHQLTSRKKALDNGEEVVGTTVERTKKGVFFTYLGLVRNLLEEKFGDNAVGKAVNNIEGLTNFNRRKKMADK